MQTKSIINLAICLILFTMSIGFCGSLKKATLQFPSTQAAIEQDNVINLIKPPELFNDLSILGGPLATRKLCVEYIKRKNPLPLIIIRVDKLVDIFYEEGMKEGVRPDVALAQSLHETGNFRYGGDVLPLQNNYAGIGAIGNKVKGASFSTPTLGIKSQIQHLLAYSTTKLPVAPIVDPRYGLLTKIPAKYGQIKTWQGLSGNWAVPGVGYGDKILKIHREILAMPI